MAQPAKNVCKAVDTCLAGVWLSDFAGSGFWKRRLTSFSHEVCTWMREVKLFSLESACDQSAMLLLQGRRYRAWLIETCDSAAVKPAVQPAVQLALQQGRVCERARKADDAWVLDCVSTFIQSISGLWRANFWRFPSVINLFFPSFFGLKNFDTQQDLEVVTVFPSQKKETWTYTLYI